MKILQESGAGDLINSIPQPQNEQTTICLQDDRPSKTQDESDSLSVGDNSSGIDNVSTTESASLADNVSMADNVSVASHGSASTAVTINIENEELIEKLKGMTVIMFHTCIVTGLYVIRCDFDTTFRTVSMMSFRTIFFYL